MSPGNYSHEETPPIAVGGSAIVRSTDLAGTFRGDADAPETALKKPPPGSSPRAYRSVPPPEPMLVPRRLRRMSARNRSVSGDAKGRLAGKALRCLLLVDPGRVDDDHIHARHHKTCWPPHPTPPTYERREASRVEAA